MAEGNGSAGLGDGMAIPSGDCALTEWGQGEVVTRRPSWAHVRKERAACEGVSSQSLEVTHKGSHKEYLCIQWGLALDQQFLC